MEHPENDFAIINNKNEPTPPSEGLGSSPCSPVWAYAGGMSGGGYAVGQIGGWSVRKWTFGEWEKETASEINDDGNYETSTGYFHKDSETEYATFEECFKANVRVIVA